MKKILILVFFLSLLLPMTVFGQNADLELCDNFVENGLEEPPSCAGIREALEYVPPVKEYTIPFLPKPTGVPGFEASNREDPEEARQYFLQTLLPRVTQMLIGLIAVVSFVVLLYAGTMYLTTFGDEDQAGKAKDAILYALIGLVVSVLSFAIVQIISSLPFQ